jgi:hypothetical protein
MRYWCVTFILFTSLAVSQPSACGQSVPAGNLKPGEKAEPSKSAANVAPTAPVIRIDGLCSSDLFSTKPAAQSKAAGSSGSKAAAVPAAKAVRAGCETIITRAQFEKLAAVVAPNQPPQATAQLAHFYATQLLYAQKAHELALDKDPHFDEILKFTYLQVLGRTFSNHMQQEADAKTNGLFDTYYKQHPDEFEEVQVMQISIPKQKDHSEESGPPTKVDTAAEAAAMKAEAETIRSRAIAGEDFEKLEADAYAFANAPNDSPSPDMGENTRADMAPFDKEVFALPIGQVSEVLSGTEAWHLFKVVNKHMMPPDEARKRISAKLMREAMDSLNNSVKPQFNDAYFGSPAADPAKPSGDDIN